jgi:hypothetical protein
MQNRAAFPFPSALVALLLLARPGVAEGEASDAPLTANVAASVAQDVAASVVQDTLVGTVRSVDYQTSTVELLTGVGLAIRVERVHVEPNVPVTIGGQARPLADLRRGQVLRVEYRETAAGRVVTSLEVVQPPGPGGAP